MMDKETAKSVLARFCQQWEPEISRPFFKKGLESLENAFFLIALESWDAETKGLHNEHRYMLENPESSRATYDLLNHYVVAYKLLILDFLKGEK